MSATLVSQLLPCPFCGGVAKFDLCHEGHFDGGPLAAVSCEGACHAKIPALTWHQASEIWNRRTSATQREKIS